MKPTVGVVAMCWWGKSILYQIRGHILTANATIIVCAYMCIHAVSWSVEL